MKACKFCFVLILFCWQIQAQMMTDITSDIPTDYATYHPYPAVFTPQIPPYNVEDDFSDVSNFDRFEFLFDTYDLNLLRRNHFAVRKCRYTQLYDIYNESTYDATPVFVTTDAVLPIYHVLFDKMLAKIEMNRFVTALTDLTDEMIRQTERRCIRILRMQPLPRLPGIIWPTFMSPVNYYSQRMSLYRSAYQQWLIQS